MTEYVIAVMAAALVQQAFLSRTEDAVPSAARFAGASIPVMTVSAALCALLDTAVLVPLALEGLRVLCFPLVVAATAWGTALFLRGNAPDLYAALHTELGRMPWNCAILGAALAYAEGGLGKGALTGFGLSLLFAVVSLVLAGIRTRIDDADLPGPVRGAPAVLLCAALASMALLGLTGLSFG